MENKIIGLIYFGVFGVSCRRHGSDVINNLEMRRDGQLCPYRKRSHVVALRKITGFYLNLFLSSERRHVSKEKFTWNISG